MNGVGSNLPGGVNNSGKNQITLGRRRWTDWHRLVRQLHMKSGAVDFRKNGNARDPQFPQGANDADGDLAPIGDKNLLKEWHRSRLTREKVRSAERSDPPGRLVVTEAGGQRRCGPGYPSRPQAARPQCSEPYASEIRSR